MSEHAHAANKRELEESTAESDGPAAKRVKADDSVITAAEPTDAEQAEVTATEAHAEPAENGVRPIKLGYRTFHSGNAASDYISEVLHKLKPGEKVNEYELLVLLDLLQKGHPRAAEKLVKGCKAIVVQEFHGGNRETLSTCFHIQALDGSLQDFSYRKCLQTLFPDYVMKESTQQPHQQRGRSGRGGGRGGRGSRGGRGGRSKGRGRK